MKQSLTLRGLAVVCLAVAWSWAPPSGASEVGSITGIVTANDSSKTPLAYANVIVVGTNLGAMSLADGSFTIPGVPPGKYTVKALMMGYKALEKKNVVVKAGAVVTVGFRLTETIVCKTQVILVTSDKPMVEVTESGIISMPSTSSERLEAMPIDNVLEAVGLKAGISKSGAGTHVRGGRSGHQRDQRQRRPRRTRTPQPESTIERLHEPGTFNTENYRPIIDNEFLEVLNNPESTFSIDVDAASYTNVRRFLNTGQLPARGAVRIEEMVNYFSYDYPEPDGKVPFTITTDAWPCPWNKGNRLARIALQGKRLSYKNLPPTNLVFLLDVSGSMKPGNKLPLVRETMLLLLDHLRKRDRVAIVVYAGEAGLVLESTPGNKKDVICKAIRDLRAGGSTAGAAGIKLAYQVAAENLKKDGINRVILATDGDFNVGTSNDAELVKLMEKERERGIFLTILGFGTGNLEDERMERIADNGNGHYAYVDNISEARRLFIDDVGATLYTIAKDVKIQVEFNPAHVSAYRLIGYENRMLKREDFDNDRKDAGELGAGHSVTAFYEIVPTAENEVSTSDAGSIYIAVGVNPGAWDRPELLTVKFRYKPPKKEKSILLTRELRDEGGDFRDAPGDVVFAAAVVEFGLILRDSEFKANASINHVLTAARSVRGEDPHGHRAEFVRLVEIAQPLLNPVSQSTDR